MLRSLASGVSGLADSLSPLYRSPDEQLTAAWHRVSAALQHASASASASVSSGDSAAASEAELRWCTPALLRSLNQMTDALRREAQHTARRTGHSRSLSHTPPGHSGTHRSSQSRDDSSGSTLEALQHHSASALSPPRSGLSGVAGTAGGDVQSDSRPPAGPYSAASSLPAPTDDSACVSCLLRHSAVEQLCALGVSDRPAGMRSLVVRSLSAILSCPSTAVLLVQPAVCAALVRLLAASFHRGDQRNKGTRRSVLALCRTVGSHIAHSGAVAEVWLCAAPSLHSLSSAPSGCHLLCAMLASMVNFWSAGAPHTLTSSLAALPPQPRPGAHTRVVRTAACRSDEGDICATALFDLACSQSTAVHAALLQADYTGALVGGVVELLAQLPPVSVCPPISLLLADHAAGRALSGRLQAIDALCLCGPASLVLPLCSDFRLRVLEAVMAPLLCDVREDVAGWASTLLCHVFKRTDSQSLARTIAACLLAVSQHAIHLSTSCTATRAH